MRIAHKIAIIAQKKLEILKKKLTNNAETVTAVSGITFISIDKNPLNSWQTELIKILKQVSRRRMRVLLQPAADT